MISLRTKYREYANDPALFRSDLMIDVSGSVKRYGDVADDWQKRDAAAVDPGLRYCMGLSTDPYCILRSYYERPRGHAKTFDVGLTATYFCTFAQGQRNGYIIGTDSDVSGFTRDAVIRNIRLNPELEKIIQVNKNVITNIAEGHPGYGTRVELLSNDVASSWGILPDFVLVDEYTHWGGDGTLWGSIISSVGKRTNCLLMVIANAGFVESWQWKVREEIRNDPKWYFSRLPGPVASWMTQEMLDEQRRMLPGLSYNRVWLNEWSAAGGDALPPELIAAAFIPELKPQAGAEPGWLYIAGLDLGLKRDNAAVSVVAVPEDGKAGKIRLVAHKVWKPLPGEKVNLLDVEKYLLELEQRFGLEYINYDPWQAEHLAQTVEADSGRLSRNVRRHYSAEPFMRECPPTPANLRAQASLCIEFFNDRRVEFYPCPEMERDLRKLRVVEKNNGVRLESPRDGDGHGDLVASWLLALQVAHEVAGYRGPSFMPIDLVGPYTPAPTSIEAWQARCAEAKADFEEGFQASRSSYTFRDALSDGAVNIINPNR